MYPSESPMLDLDETVYPCKGCGEVRLHEMATVKERDPDLLMGDVVAIQILEEGKAFELGKSVMRVSTHRDRRHFTEADIGLYSK